MITKLHPRGHSYISFGSPASLLLRARRRKCASVKTPHIMLSATCKCVQSIKQLLTFSETTNFRLFQIERVLLKGEKHCGKRRNSSSRAISPFPIVFSKDLYCRHIKIKAGFICLRKGYSLLHKLKQSEYIDKYTCYLF